MLYYVIVFFRESEWNDFFYFSFNGKGGFYFSLKEEKIINRERERDWESNERNG